MMEYMKTYGGFFKLKVRPFRPTIVLADLDSISTLFGCTKEIKKAASYKYLAPWLGDGLITASGKPLTYGLNLSNDLFVNLIIFRTNVENAPKNNHKNFSFPNFGRFR